MNSLLNRSVSVRHGAFLPHWTTPFATYHVVFRLADSLPQSAIQRIRTEMQCLIERQLRGQNAIRVAEEYSLRVEAFLDSGSGACYLRHPEVARIVIDALRHFDGSRYQLLGWCVMPNHVHVVANWTRGDDVSLSMHSWKSFTAKLANQLLQRKGEFWQKESYDHIIRDDTELARVLEYVRNNPVAAGLNDWPWVWIRDSSTH